MEENKVREKYRKLTLSLIEKKISISTMESCTGGMIASLLTDTEGASGIIKGAFVTYSNEAKISCNVPSEIIDRYTVYSAETAGAMALACRNAYSADIGVGITGTFGNIDPANEAASECGTVYIAVVYKSEFVKVLTLPLMQSRFEYKLSVADAVCDMITELLC